MGSESNSFMDGDVVPLTPLSLPWNYTSETIEKNLPPGLVAK